MDTLTYANTLKASGLSNKVAEAHAMAIKGLFEEEVATKQDFQQLEMMTKSDLSSFKSDLTAFKRETKNDLKQLELRMTVKLGSIVVISSGIMLALLTAILKV